MHFQQAVALFERRFDRGRIWIAGGYRASRTFGSGFATKGNLGRQAGFVVRQRTAILIALLAIAGASLARSALAWGTPTTPRTAATASSSATTVATATASAATIAPTAVAIAVTITAVTTLRATSATRGTRTELLLAHASPRELRKRTAICYLLTEKGLRYG
jgi:hypothetical protein